MASRISNSHVNRSSLLILRKQEIGRTPKDFPEISFSSFRNVSTAHSVTKNERYFKCCLLNVRDDCQRIANSKNTRLENGLVSSPTSDSFGRCPHRPIREALVICITRLRPRSINVWVLFRCLFHLVQSPCIHHQLKVLLFLTGLELLDASQ